LPPLVHDLCPEGLGTIDGALNVGSLLFLGQVLDLADRVVAQSVQDGRVGVCGRGARRVVDGVGDEEHGVEVARASADIEHGVEVYRVGLQTLVRHQHVIVLDGLGDGKLGMLGPGAATEQDCESLDIRKLPALLHLFGE